MKPSFDSRTKPNVAFVALLVWLFALVSGVANACLIQTEKIHVYGHDHGHGSLATHSSVAETGRATSEGHVVTMPDHDSEPTGSKPQCLKVCDDGSQSLTKQRVSFDLTQPVLAPLLAVALTSATPVMSARGLAVFQRLPDLELPIRTLLSRLAL